MKVTVKVVGETIEVSAKFRKREFAGMTEGDYPQPIQFQLTQDKCNLLDGIQVGELIDVEFNIRGREWTNPQGEVKIFNSLEVWKIVREEKTIIEKAIEPAEGDGDLPF
jgi:hypothetical protein